MADSETSFKAEAEELRAQLRGPFFPLEEHQMLFAQQCIRVRGQRDATSEGCWSRGLQNDLRAVMEVFLLFELGEDSEASVQSESMIENTYITARTP